MILVFNRLHNTETIRYKIMKTRNYSLSECKERLGQLQEQRRLIAERVRFERSEMNPQVRLGVNSI